MRNKKDFFGIIYKITNKINNKVYIGQTVDSLHNRFIRHKSLCNNEIITTYLHRAMNKYGLDNFICTTLEKCSSKEELNEMEFHYIKQYNSLCPDGYNMTLGGEGTIGRICKPETRAKISKNKRGKPLSERHKKLLSNMRKGVPKSKAHILNVAKSKSKYWLIIYPNNDNVVIRNLSEFCRNNNLNDRAMGMVSRGERTHHKGFKCRKLETAKIRF